MECDILHAIHQGDVELLEYYLKTLPNPNVCIDQLRHESSEEKRTLLMIACLLGHVKMVYTLLNNYQPDLEVSNVVRLTDRDQIRETFHDVTVLWAAAAINNLEIVKLLVDHGAEVNHTTKTKSTALRCACCNNNIEMVRYLVAHGADIHITKEKHQTNLVASVFNGHLEMVTYLIDELGCDVNECLDDGRSPLSASVYNGSLELVQFLLSRGARNFLVSFDQMSPLMLAAEKRRIELVNAITPHCSIIEQIEVEELLGSAFICAELGTTELEQSFEHFSRAFELRSLHRLPKPLMESTDEVFQHRRECQTIDQLNGLRSNVDDMYIEALLVRQRVLGPRSSKYRYSLHYRGALLAYHNEQYLAGLALWMYQLALCQQYGIEIEKEDLCKFVSIFSLFKFRSVPIPFASLHTVITITLGELECNAKDFDYHLHTLLFLITIVSQNPLDSTVSDSDYRAVHQLMRRIIQRQYSTCAIGSSLLHMSLNEWTAAGHYLFSHKYKYPCLSTVHLLLHYGADVNAIDVEGNTPLHIFVSNTSDGNEAILQLLCDAGAHLDYANSSEERASDMVINANTRQFLQTRMSLSLKCLCARLIQKKTVSYHGQISKLLATFVERH